MSGERLSAESDQPDCRCLKPNRPTGREPEQLPPWKCLTCGGYACEYAERGATRCSPAICDCFIVTHPDSPRDLHPEAFIVVGEDFDAQAEFLRSLGLDPDTATHADLLPALSSPPAHPEASCDCETCVAGDDRWCCRRCRDLAREA